MSDLLSNTTTRRMLWIATLLSLCGMMALFMGVNVSHQIEQKRIVPPPVAFAPLADQPGVYSADPDRFEYIGGANQYVAPKLGPIVALPNAPLASIDGNSRRQVTNFIDDEPVLYVRTSVWAATSDYIWQLYPHQTLAAHENTVFYRVLALRLRHPATNWDVVAYWTPFMSVRGIAG